MSITETTVHLDVDERYPDALLVEPGAYGSVTAEVAAETVERWRRVCAEYEAVQTEMLAAYRAARGKR